MMQVKLLDLKAVTRMHAAEYHEAVTRVTDSGWYLLGEETKRFEQAYATYVGTRFCVAVANGLDALRLVLRGYMELGRLHEGDEIIVPANTYIATILAITDNGLNPVFVEPTFEGLELDTSAVEKALTPRTRGVMTVHLYGRIAYDEVLKEVCRKHGLMLFEDCAQSHGCEYRGRKTGALGNAAAHSFYPGKNMGAFGDAGAITTDDESLEEVVRALANYGSERKYHFRFRGINSRMSEMDAAVLSVKLKYLDRDNDHRRRAAAYYYGHIRHPEVFLPAHLPDANNVYHQFPVFCERRDELQEHLRREGVQTLIHYPIPPHQQPCYSQWHDRSYPVTERIHAQELSLPMHQALTDEEVRYTVEVINAFQV